ncbi:MAG: PQQ-binding-like beta-propeller repeat protein, partial [Acidobacteriota bacterium]
MISKPLADARGTAPILPLADARDTEPAQTADSWPQFRANHNLTGVAASTVPDNLKLLWTYDAGESIESSAAIADGTVYVGASTGDLLDVYLFSGKLKWKYKTKDMIMESSP